MSCTGSRRWYVVVAEECFSPATAVVVVVCCDPPWLYVGPVYGGTVGPGWYAVALAFRRG